MRVLDLGCGAGDVSMLAAELTGPAGSVVGIDRSQEVLNVAKERAQVAGLQQIDFVRASIEDFSVDEPFDLVIGRYILVHHSEPVALLRKAAELVRPAGTLAFHEVRMDSDARSFPYVPLWHLTVKLVQIALQSSVPNYHGAVIQKVGRMELADQGTLFLDEVGDIPIDIQPKLLRALQEKEFERLGSTHTRKVNLRLVAATNRHLEKMVADREFRSDLFYRLNVFPIRIPPLRERKEDIPLLVSYFVQKFSKQMQKRIDSIPVATMKALTAWDWPGNIRELENFIERAVILTHSESLAAPLAELRNLTDDEPTREAPPAGEDDIARIVKETIASLKGKTEPTERTKKQHDEIVRVLTECKGRVGGADGAAVRMGLSRTTLISRMKKLGINPYDFE